MAKFTAHPYDTAFERAEEFLAKGNNKHSRPLQNNTYMARVDENTIAIVLHSTAVVTYHRDQTFTIYGNGWNTITTKDRIRGWSPVNHLFTVNHKWVVGTTGELTPPRVQKCRSCRGRGRWMENDVCHPPSWVYTPLLGHVTNYCDGEVTKYRVEWNLHKRAEGVPDNWDEHYKSRYTEPCQHGRNERHRIHPCEHGHHEQHVTGQSERCCYRCEGKGRADYGSKPIPITVSTSVPYKVDRFGTFIGTLNQAPYAPSKYAPTKKAAKVANVPQTMHIIEPDDPHTYGGEIVDRLAKVLPNIRSEARHPITGDMVPINSIIVSLNDKHHWSRESIADWLDTLDVDLRFPAVPNERSVA